MGQRRKSLMAPRASKLWEAVAVMAALAVGATGLAVVGPITPAGATPTEVTSGQIVWGVKQSFRDYVVGGIANGTITPSGGATQASSNGVFTFPNSTGTYDAGTEIDVASEGSVNFQGHFTGGEPELDLTISNVRIEATGASGFIVADIESLPLGEEEVDVLDDVQVVSLDLSSTTPTTDGDTVTYANVPTALTSAGAAVFMNYTAGTAFDPVTFSMTLEEAPEPPADLGSLTWKISEYAWTSSSLAPAREAGTPAVVDPTNGFVFPVTSVDYDEWTGATQVDFAGSATIGNFVQGAYRVRFQDLRISVDDTGAGALEAVATYCTGSGGSSPCSGTWAISPERLTIVSFQANPSAIVDTGDHVSAVYTAPAWPLTGPFPNAVDAFDAELIGFLTPSTPSLLGHFRATGATGTNPNKPPAPMQVEFDYEPEPAVGGVEIITTVVGGGITMSVDSDQVVLPSPTLNSAGTALETSGALGTVRVVDTRTSDPGWNATAQITDFTGASTIGGDSLGWVPSVTSTSPGQSVTAGSPVAPGAGLTGAQLASALAGSGLGTAELDALLNLAFPTNASAGTYTATLTITAI